MAQKKRTPNMANNFAYGAFLAEIKGKLV